MLTQRTVMITGASAGIGAACAHTMASAGARLILVARRQDRLSELASQLADTECHLLALDVRDRDAVNNAINGLPDAWSTIDLLINNAGLSRGLDKLQAADDDDWNEMIDTNIKGLLWVSRAVLPGLRPAIPGQVTTLSRIHT